MLLFLNPAETDQQYFEKGLFWTSLEIQTSVNGGKYQSRRGKIIFEFSAAAATHSQPSFLACRPMLLGHHGLFYIFLPDNFSSLGLLHSQLYRSTIKRKLSFDEMIPKNVPPTLAHLPLPSISTLPIFTVEHPPRPQPHTLHTSASSSLPLRLGCSGTPCSSLLGSLLLIR